MIKSIFPKITKNCRDTTVYSEITIDIVVSLARVTGPHVSETIVGSFQIQYL